MCRMQEGSYVDTESAKTRPSSSVCESDHMLLVGAFVVRFVLDRAGAQGLHGVQGLDRVVYEERAGDIGPHEMVVGKGGLMIGLLRTQRCDSSLPCQPSEQGLKSLTWMPCMHLTLVDLGPTLTGREMDV